MTCVTVCDIADPGYRSDILDISQVDSQFVVAVRFLVAAADCSDNTVPVGCDAGEKLRTVSKLCTASYQILCYF